MYYDVVAITDIGICKEINQDSLTVKMAKTKIGPVAFAVLCDGMGGLAKGELASKTVIRAFSDWFLTRFQKIMFEENLLEVIKKEWLELVLDQNMHMQNYGIRNGIQIGTTATCLIMCKDQYCILNIGDTRAYIIRDKLEQITQDHTLIAKEIEMGLLTEEEGKVDERRNILLQCIGASNHISPDFYTGTIQENSVFMLCSDGFRHEISVKEFEEYLRPQELENKQIMLKHANYLVELNKKRKEPDNISVILIRTYRGGNDD